MVSVKDYIRQDFPVQCRGRDKRGNKVLAEPVDVTVEIFKRQYSSNISSFVHCPYIIFRNGQSKCVAALFDSGAILDSRNVRKSATCPYEILTIEGNR